MINEKQLEYLCNKYRIKYQIIETTNIVLLSTGLDDWMIRYIHGRDRPYCLLHKNKLRQTSKYHVQRWLRTLFQSLDVIVRHKKVLSQIYAPQNTYRKDTNIKTNNNKMRKQFC